MTTQEGNIMRCQVTGKICYTEREAGRVINSSKRHVYAGNRRWIKGNHNNSKNIPRRKYFCRECGFFHVTHKPLYDMKSRCGLWEEEFYREYEARKGA